MSKFIAVIKVILMIFGVLFLLEVVAVIYLIVADPFGIRDLMRPPAEEQRIGANDDKHPLLDERQEAVLESIGIDPSTLPSEITPAQEDCMREAVGEERAAEIEAGAEPTPSDYLKAKHCL